MAPTTLADLPPELLDHIATYLPTAQSISRLSKTSKSLYHYTEKDAWQTFNRTCFPSLHPASTTSPKSTARTLTTLSKSWDRRAFVARYVEPTGDIHAYPGARKVERWKRPRGQTIGFTPQLDVYEEIGSRWQDRKETLAFSAGAEVCVRKKSWHNGRESTRWMTYRPLSAFEGRDDVTVLHLLRPEEGEAEGLQRVVSGTANGDLWILSLSEGQRGDVPITYFVTQGNPVRSSSLLERPGAQGLLAASLGDSRISVFPVDHAQAKIAPLSSIDTPQPEVTNGQRARHQRIWSTQFLSPQQLAVGIGPSDQPLHIYSLTSSGLNKEPLRKFGLHNDFEISCLDSQAAAPPSNGPTKRTSSSIYPIIPLPPSSSASSSSAKGTVFLSGAYDSIIRLHDLRSNRDVEQSFADPTDDSAIYSLLPRGQEQIVAGTSRHSLLKVFDLRLGAKSYDYLDAGGAPQAPGEERWRRNWNLFVKPHGASSSGNAARAGQRGSYYSSGSRESSVYSLASPSASSPFLYAGVEGAVVELAFTGVQDRHPDPTFFRSMKAKEEVLNLAMYDQSAGSVKLYTQRSVADTWRMAANPVGHTLEFPRVEEGLDERWRVGGG